MLCYRPIQRLSDDRSINLNLCDHVRFSRGKIALAFCNNRKNRAHWIQIIQICGAKNDRHLVIFGSCHYIYYWWSYRVDFTPNTATLRWLVFRQIKIDNENQFVFTSKWPLFGALSCSKAWWSQLQCYRNKTVLWCHSDPSWPCDMAA